MKFQQPALALAMGLAVSSTVYASPIVLDSGFFDNEFTGGTLNGSTNKISFGDFWTNFFGVWYDFAYINENGNITLATKNSGNPYGDHKHPDLAATEQVIIAPFFSDVDVFSSDGSGSITYGTGSFDGRDAFAVNWMDVSYYRDSSNEDLNSFQLLLVDRHDSDEYASTVGDFDIVFNYDPLSWDFGDLSAGYFPLAGFSNPGGYVNNTVDFTDSTFYELPGSGQPGAFLDGGSEDLAADKYNSDILGRYVYEFRGGDFVNRPPDPVPTPATLLLLIIGLLLGLPFARRRVLNG